MIANGIVSEMLLYHITCVTGGTNKEIAATRINTMDVPNFFSANAGRIFSMLAPTTAVIAAKRRGLSISMNKFWLSPFVKMQNGMNIELKNPRSGIAAVPLYSMVSLEKG